MANISKMIFTFMVTVGIAVTAPGLGWAKEPILSLRYTGGPEVELHMGSVGVLGGIIPGAFKAHDSFGGVTICEASYDQTYIGGRFFFKGVQDSWYLGAFHAVNELTSPQHCTLKPPETMTWPMIGYHWMWDAGFNIDLGIRPGFLGLGWSF